MKKSLFIIGDIHGCYYSFKELLDTHWNPEQEQLIQVGDLISKGKHSPRVIELARKLEASHGAVFLQGNHEYKAINHYINKVQSLFWEETFLAPMETQYEKYKRDLLSDIKWSAKNPLIWENDQVLVSHASISMMAAAYSPHSHFGLLWHRTPLKNVGKLQVIGHTPKPQPIYDPVQNYINVDTGAFKGEFLTAAKVSVDGVFERFVSVLADERDVF